jgi:hypothetical protein
MRPTTTIAQNSASENNKDLVVTLVSSPHSQQVIECTINVCMSKAALHLNELNSVFSSLSRKDVSEFTETLEAKTQLQKFIVCLSPLISNLKELQNYFIDNELKYERNIYYSIQDLNFLQDVFRDHTLQPFINEAPFIKNLGAVTSSFKELSDSIFNHSKNDFKDFTVEHLPTYHLSNEIRSLMQNVINTPVQRRSKDSSLNIQYA